MRPIELLPLLVNHKAPSGPVVIPSGKLMLGSLKVVSTPDVERRSMAPARPIGLPRPPVPPKRLVNQRAPSGPEVTSEADKTLGSVLSLIAPEVVMRSLPNMSQT